MTTTTLVDQVYFDWLISQIEIRSKRTYHRLFERLHETEFIWTIPHDNNRCQDALDLRTEFLNEGHERFPQKRFQKFVCMLEVLIALSRRTAFVAGGDPEWWAWQLLVNLGLYKSFDPWSDNKAQRVDHILENLIWRTYERNGQGGFFPLTETLEDQTKVEIWYQMQAYVNEISQP